MDCNDIYEAILAGQADDGLDLVGHAIKERRAALKQHNFADLQVGDRVRIDSSNLRPKYIHGAEAEVVEKRITKITILFDDLPNRLDPYGKFRNKQIVVPADALVKIEA